MHIFKVLFITGYKIFAERKMSRMKMKKKIKGKLNWKRLKRRKATSKVFLLLLLSQIARKRMKLNFPILQLTSK